MPEPLLLLRLEGPMQSWGVRARWDMRDTGPEPTKSGIVGMLGCALRLHRGSPELARLSAELRFGVRADRPGVVATDYHTVTGRHRMANDKLKSDDYTVQSYRDYLHDASFLVVLAGQAARLACLAEAVRHPEWPIYLGRKSCVPTRPVLDCLCHGYASVEDALCKAPWAAPADPGARRAIARTFAPDSVPEAFREWAGRGEWQPGATTYRLTAWVDDPAGDYERQDVVQTDPLRFYGFRRCRRIPVPIEGLEVMKA